MIEIKDSEVVKDLERLRNEEHAALREEFDAWMDNRFTKRLREDYQNSLSRCEKDILDASKKSENTSSLGAKYELLEIMCGENVYKRLLTRFNNEIYHKYANPEQRESMDRISKAWAV